MGGSNPTVARFFREKYWQIICVRCFFYVTKILLVSFSKHCKALAFLGSCHVTSSWQEVNENLKFLRFLVHISKKFQYFLWNLYGSKVLSSSVADIKSLLISALVSLETRLKVPILTIFDDFWHFSSCLF